MARENRILLLTGLALLALTMIFGFYYAVFDEHQTLSGMGIALASGFMEAANGDMVAANAALERYGQIAIEYKRELHFHGHWGFLGIVLILIGLVIHTLKYNDATRVRLALLFSASSFLFPLGISLQIGPLSSLGAILAAAGTAGLLVSMLVFAIGVMRSPE